MGQWNHVDCSQPSPDSPDYPRWKIKQELILNGDISEDDPDDFIDCYLESMKDDGLSETKFRKIK